MQSHDMARKVIIEIDGQENTDLVKLGEIFLESLPIEVPSLKKIFSIVPGVTKINPIVLLFKQARNSTTKKLLQDWVDQVQSKDITISEVDGSGTEYARTILKDCEAGSLKIPEYDAANPTYAQMEVTIYPFDVKELK